MDGQRRLWQAVSSARRSLHLEKFLIALQKGLLYAVLSITVVYFVTRFFVLPYYALIGWVVAVAGLFIPLVMAFWKRTQKREALLALDQYYPHNELVTVLTAKERTPLVDILQQKAEVQVGQVLESFKKRPKHVFQPKIMAKALGILVLFLLLNMFPAATQQEAKSIEEDRAITKDLKDKVTEQIEKPIPEETKKELAELQQAIAEAKTSDEALKELVKKQKELTNLEQQLVEEAKGNMTPEMQQALESLGQVNKELAQAASEAQSEMSKLGKPIDLNTQKSIAGMRLNAGENPSNSAGEQSNTNGNDSGQNNSTGTSGSNSNQGTSSQSGANSNNSQQGSGQSGQSGGSSSSSQQGTGNQPGNGQNGSGGAGQGGSGTGSGNGGGGGQGGLMGGKGSGGRDLVAIPQRVGESNGSTVDGGLLGEGETVTERGPVPATKGDVRPYSEVIGSYQNSYMQSTDRLQLPSDLQQMVQNYYSSIEQ